MISREKKENTDNYILCPVYRKKLFRNSEEKKSERM